MREPTAAYAPQMSEGMEWFWLPGVPMILGWLLTVAFGVLGATTVRRVDARAGWMIVVASGMEILLGLAGVAVPLVMTRTRSTEEIATSMAFWGLFAGTLGLFVRGLFFAAIVSLAASRARRPREEPHVV